MGSFDQELHLHRFYGYEGVSLVHLLTWSHKYLGYSAWHWTLDLVALGLHYLSNVVIGLRNAEMDMASIYMVEVDLSICSNSVIKLVLFTAKVNYELVLLLRVYHDLNTGENW